MSAIEAVLAALVIVGGLAGIAYAISIIVMLADNERRGPRCPTCGARTVPVVRVLAKGATWDMVARDGSRACQGCGWRSSSAPELRLGSDRQIPK